MSVCNYAELCDWDTERERGELINKTKNKILKTNKIHQMPGAQLKMEFLPMPPSYICWGMMLLYCLWNNEIARKSKGKEK